MKFRWLDNCGFICTSYVSISFLILYFSDTSLDLILQLNQAEPENKVCQNSNVMAPLQSFGMTPDVTAPTVKETEMLSQQLKVISHK